MTSTMWCGLGQAHLLFDYIACMPQIGKQAHHNHTETEISGNYILVYPPLFRAGKRKCGPSIINSFSMHSNMSGIQQTLIILKVTLFESPKLPYSRQVISLHLTYNYCFVSFFMERMPLISFTIAYVGFSRSRRCIFYFLGQ